MQYKLNETLLTVLGVFFGTLYFLAGMREGETIMLTSPYRRGIMDTQRSKGMRKVYLVTAEDSKIIYGDSLTIGGVFSTEEEAYDYATWAAAHNFLDNSWQVTEMTVDDPRSNNEYEDYPSAYYEE